MEPKILFINFKSDEAQECIQYVKDNLEVKVDCQLCSIEDERKMLIIGTELVFIDIDLENHQLSEIVHKIKAEKSIPEIISIWETDRFVVLRPEEIIYCYTTDRKTTIKTKDREYFSINTLASFEQKLGKCGFFRTHKSFLVNQNYIKEIVPWFNHTYNLVMDYCEHDEVPVSRTYLKEFKQRMGIE